MEQILKFFDNSGFAFWRLKFNGKKIYSNDDKSDVEVSRGMLENYLQFCQTDGEIEFECWEKRNGHAKPATVKVTVGEGLKPEIKQAPAFSIENSSTMQAYLLGLQHGKEQGSREEKMRTLEDRLRRLEDGESSRGFDMQAFAESPLGQLIISKFE